MKEKFTQNKQLAYCGLLLFFLLFSNKGFSAAFYMRASGNWSGGTYYTTLTGTTVQTANSGIPGTNDDVYLVANNATALTLTINITSAICNSLSIVSNTTTTATTWNIRFGESNTATITRNLTINGNFDVKTYYTAGGTAGTQATPLSGALVRTVNVFRNSTSVTSSMWVKGNVIVGDTSAITLTPSTRLNVVNMGTYNGPINQYNAPDLQVDGNVNTYSKINAFVSGAATQVNASRFNLNSGTMTLTGDTLTDVPGNSTTAGTPGTTGKGYIYNYVNGTGLSTDNKFYITDNAANLTLRHRNDCPFIGIIATNYSQIVPNLDLGTVRYEYTGVGATVKSTILNVNHHNLILNNTAEVSTVGSANLKVGNELTVESGNFTVASIIDMISDTGSSSYVTIKGGKIVSSNSGYLNFTNPTTITYSNNASETGIELPNALSAGKLDVLSLNNTNGATFTFNNNVTSNTINLSKNGFTLSGATFTGNTAINLEGNAVYNCDLLTSTLNIKNSCTFAKSQTIYTENSSNNTTTGAISIGGGTGITEYTIKLTNNAVIKTSDLTIIGNTILDATSVGKFNVYRYVAMPNNASRNLTSNGILVLKSNNFQTARVDSYLSPAKGRILGDVVVERYLQNSNRRWRLLTAPVVSGSNSSIWNNWQNNGSVIRDSEVNGLPVNGYGTDVWGPDPSYTISGNGMYYLDPPTGTQTQASSSHNFRKWGYFYDNTAQQEIWKFANVTNSKTELMNDGTINNAFLAFVVKPFGYGATVTNGVANQVLGSTSTTLAAKGTLLYGDQSYTTTTDTFTLIANPYASSINFNDFLDANDDVLGSGAIYSKLWFLDPSIGKGGYVTYDALGWSNQNARHKSYSGVIQSGEGFFVMGGPSAGSAVISETMKTTSSYAFIFGRTASSASNAEKLRVNLEKMVDGVSTNIDACLVGFYDGASNDVTTKDVQKLTNPEETIAFVNGTTKLSAEHRAPIASGDSLFISLTKAYSNTNYTLKLNTENFSFNGTATFYDLFLGTQTNIALDGSVFEYPFAVTTDATTQGTRFKITFTAALGINTFANNEGISAYPNPVSKSETLNINMGTLAKGNYAYRLVNMIGQEVQTGTIENNTSNQEPSITFSKAINSGLYVVELTDDSKSVHTLRIIIK